MAEQKRLYRSGKDHILGGVCAGLAEYLNIDAVLVRVLWLVSVMFNGIGLLAYLLCLFFIPMNPEHAALPESERKKSGQTGLFVGIAFVVFGFMFLFFNIAGHHFFWFDWCWFGFWPFRWNYIWPLFIIGFGVWYIIYSLRKDKEQNGENQTILGTMRFYRKKENRMISGVCSGLAEYWNIDVTLVRIGLVVLTLVTHVFMGIALYVALVFIIPEKEQLQSNMNVSQDPS